MPEEFTPYLPQDPGDLITAEAWNEVQIEVKKDIHARVGEVQKDLDDFKEAPVDADTFDGKTPQDWTDQFDQRYAQQMHSHDTVKQYQRLFLEMETMLATTPPRLQPAVIIHNMKRHPQVQVYELLDLPLMREIPDNTLRSYKFAIAGPPHASDPEAMEFKTRSWDERHWGDPLDSILEGLMWELSKQERKALQAKFKPSFTLNAWIANLEETLFEPGPAQYHFDMGDVYRTQWVKDRANQKVEDLMNAGEWPPRLVYRPRLIDMIDVAIEPNDNHVVIRHQGVVEIYHLNMNEVEIQPIYLNDDDRAPVSEVHLMVLLKV